jgi:hypothetical protein
MRIPRDARNAETPQLRTSAGPHPVEGASRRAAPEAVNALVGRDVTFKLGDRALPFTTEGFLMSFSLPNFFFHAATAYDILRHKGAPLGKRDFMGKIKLKR